MHNLEFKLNFSLGKNGTFLIFHNLLENLKSLGTPRIEIHKDYRNLFGKSPLCYGLVNQKAYHYNGIRNVLGRDDSSII